VDGSSSVTNSPIEVKLYGLSLEDDEQDAVYTNLDFNKDEILDNGLNSTPVALDSNADISVTPSGTLSINADSNNDDNDEAKTILAGTDAFVFSTDIIADNEKVKIEKIVFTVNKDLTQAANSASIYLDDKLIATNSNSDINATSITFENLTKFIVLEENSELRLKINSAALGKDNTGIQVENVQVTGITVNASDVT